MERIMRSQSYQKANDPNQEYYGSQKKTLEINPRHPLVKELKKRVEADAEDPTSRDLGEILLETATLRGGYILPDTAAFAGRIERMLRLSMDISLEEAVEAEVEFEEEEDADEEELSAEDDITEEAPAEDHDEL